MNPDIFMVCNKICRTNVFRYICHEVLNVRPSFVMLYDDFVIKRCYKCSIYSAASSVVLATCDECSALPSTSEQCLYLGKSHMNGIPQGLYVVLR